MNRARTIAVGLLVGLAASGCPASPSEDDGGSSDGGTTVGDSTGPASTGPATTAPGSTGTTMGSADDASTGTPMACEELVPEGEACMPPGSASVAWELRIDGVPLANSEQSGSCMVLDVVDDGATSTISMDCTRFQAELDLTTTDPHHVPELAPGEMVELHITVFLESKDLEARYLTLRQADLVLAAFEASVFDLPASFDVSPVALQVVATDCEARPTECIWEQDAALQVDFDGQTELLFPHQDAFVGQLTSYRAITGELERIVCYPDDCGAEFAEWLVQGVVIRVPEG